MSGQFIAVVGPSGVGKDTVMAAMAAAEPRLRLVRRVVTRPSAAGGEDFDGVTEAGFDRMQEAGQFALSWPAHGLRYGIPKQVDRDLAEGHDLLANLSRAALPEAQARFARFQVVQLTATPEVLRNRLLARGRETSAQIEGRLARADYALSKGIAAHVIDNSEALEQTVRRALDLLYQVKA